MAQLLGIGMLIVSCGASCSSSPSADSGVPERIVSKNAGTVATFVFEQFSDDRITLKIEGIWSPKSSFTYVVKFSPRTVSADAPPWESEGAVRDLQAKQTVDKGTVARNPAPIDQGDFDITLRMLQ